MKELAANLEVRWERTDAKKYFQGDARDIEVLVKSIRANLKVLSWVINTSLS